MIEIKKIVSRSLLIKTNTYVVTCDGEAVIIDADAETDQLKKVLGENKVKGVILTHAHFDHITNIEKIISEFKTKCYLSKPAVNKLANPALNCSAMLGFKDIHYIDEKNLIEVKDGDELDLLNEKIKIISTPGHSDCSICIKIGDIIFSGDTLFDGCEGRTDIVTSSPQAMIESIRHLNNEYKGTKIYPGHGREGII